MALSFGDPFEALLQFQQALDSVRSSDWLGSSLSGRGGYPPINVFRKGETIWSSLRKFRASANRICRFK